MTDEFLSTRLSEYQILEELGRGGFAVVYKAVDASSNRIVALKVLAPHLVWDKDFVSRFQREASTVARLDHPNIVAIHDVGEADGNHYISMDYLEGFTLKQIIEQEGALPLERAAHIVQQLASALDHAHQKGISHRDIKPSNIIIGPQDHVTLTDFGIVKATEGTRLTSTGVTLGTPEYMSPEQGQGLDVDRRSDIYSLGVVLYEMLTGKVPFSGTSPLAVLHKHVYETPTALQVPNPRLPQWLDRVVAKALSKSPNHRFSTAGEMATAVLKGEQMAPTMRIPSVSKPARSKTRRRVAWGSLISAAAVVILCAIGARIMAQSRAVPTQTTATTIPLAIASTSTATQTVTPTPSSTSTPTLTATPSPTRTRRPTSTPVPTPTVPMWTLALVDNFDNPHSGFSENSNENRRALYQGGRYVMEVTSEGWVFWTTRGSFSDFVAEVDVTSQGDSGIAALVFRNPSNYQLYRFTINTDGLYYLHKKTARDESEALLRWQRSPHIRTGASTNRLRVVCIGPQISMYVNNHFLDTFVDSTYVEGSIGMAAGTFTGESHALFYFNNLRVYEPPEASEPATSACPAEVGCLRLVSYLGSEVTFTIGADGVAKEVRIEPNSAELAQLPPGQYTYTVSSAPADPWVHDSHGEMAIRGGTVYELRFNVSCGTSPSGQTSCSIVVEQ